MAMGFPLLAAFQSGVFYPPHLLLLILSFFPAIRVIFILHFLIAGNGAYYLCRNWKFPPYLSIVGALLFASRGYNCFPKQLARITFKPQFGSLGSF